MARIAYIGTWPQMHFLDLQQLDCWLNDCRLYVNVSMVLLLVFLIRQEHCMITENVNSDHDKTSIKDRSMVMLVPIFSSNWGSYSTDHRKLDK